MADPKDRLKSYEERAFEDIGEVITAAHNQMLATHAFYAQALGATGLAVERKRAHCDLAERRGRETVVELQQARADQAVAERERNDLRNELCQLRMTITAQKVALQAADDLGAEAVEKLRRVVEHSFRADALGGLVGADMGSVDDLGDALRTSKRFLDELDRKREADNG